MRINLIINVPSDAHPILVSQIIFGNVTLAESIKKSKKIENCALTCICDVAVTFGRFYEFEYLIAKTSSQLQPFYVFFTLLESNTFLPLNSNTYAYRKVASFNTAQLFCNIF